MNKAEHRVINRGKELMGEFGWEKRTGMDRE